MLRHRIWKSRWPLPLILVQLDRSFAVPPRKQCFELTCFSTFGKLVVLVAVVVVVVVVLVDDNDVFE
jgi:hypothetical protein